MKVVPVAAALVLGLTGCQDHSTGQASSNALAASTSATHFDTTIAGKPSQLPNKKLTPGAVNAAVTAAQVCTAGFVAKAVAVSDDRAAEVFVKYGVDNVSSYQLDHLVPISLGGSNAQANLWPQLKSQSVRKDTLENRLHNMVCQHKLALASAQRIVRTNWQTALTKYGTSTKLTYTSGSQLKPAVATTTPPPTTSAPTTTAAAPTTTVAPQPAPTTTVDDHGGATAMCNDGTLSFSAHHQGTCSHHGGVAIWYR